MHWGECSGPHRVSSRWSLLAMAASVSPLGQHPLWCTVLDHLLAHLCVYDCEDIVIRVLLVWEDQGPLQTIRRQRYRCSLTVRLPHAMLPPWTCAITLYWPAWSCHGCNQIFSWESVVDHPCTGGSMPPAPLLPGFPYILDFESVS